MSGYEWISHNAFVLVSVIGSLAIALYFWMRYHKKQEGSYKEKERGR